jgi:CheY-like chemotaxis protein
MATMSHELRTPLNAILGFSELMSRDKTMTVSQKETLAIINRSGAHLLSMINDVLDISKIEAGHLELNLQACDLIKLLQEIGEMISVRALNNHLHFKLELSPDTPQYVKVDTGKLRQVLINLLGNAIKFTQTGGVILRTQTLPIAMDKIMLTIEVVDSGVGIPTDKLDILFQPFVQLAQENSDVKGTGLGLAISKSLIELMKGRISVNSVLGVGSTFKIDLPLLVVSTEEITIEKESLPIKSLAPNQPAWRLLIVDDNADNRLLLVKILTEVGFEVREAENGQEAIQVFEEWQPALCWMDMRMPVMDGYQATAQIRQLAGGDKVKIIALTASAFTEQHADIIAVGCDAVLHKPFHAPEIFTALTRYLGVQFIYQDEPNRLSLPAHELTAEIIANQLPLALQEQLHDAALNLDIEKTDDLIAKIRLFNPDMAISLQQLAEHYQFEQIIQLTDRGTK